MTALQHIRNALSDNRRGMLKVPKSGLGQGALALFSALITATTIFIYVMWRDMEAFAKDAPYDGQADMVAFFDAVGPGALTFFLVFLLVFVVLRARYPTVTTEVDNSER